MFFNVKYRDLWDRTVRPGLQAEGPDQTTETHHKQLEHHPTAGVFMLLVSLLRDFRSPVMLSLIDWAPLKKVSDLPHCQEPPGPPPMFWHPLELCCPVCVTKGIPCCPGKHVTFQPSPGFIYCKTVSLVSYSSAIISNLKNIFFFPPIFAYEFT